MNVLSFAPETLGDMSGNPLDGGLFAFESEFTGRADPLFAD